jgi:hypothetical protein
MYLCASRAPALISQIPALVSLMPAVVVVALVSRIELENQLGQKKHKKIKKYVPLARDASRAPPNPCPRLSDPSRRRRCRKK